MPKKKPNPRASAPLASSPSRFFVRPAHEIPPDEPERKRLGSIPESPLSIRVCLDACDVDGNGIQVLGDYFEGKRIIRIEGTYPGWRLVRSISTEQAALMVENVCIFLEASGDLRPK